jgi:hypothetical protein
MRRKAVVLAALIVALVVITGCGSKSGSGNAVEDSLSFMPKGSPLVATLETDPDGDQYKQVNALLGKFPFAGQLKGQLKQSVNSSTGVDFDQDVKPILGNPVVFAAPTAQALQGDNSQLLLALKVDDEGKADEFVKKDANKVSTFEGTDIYKERGETYLALKDGVIVVADTVVDIQGALKRHDGSDHMTQDDLDARLAGVTGDGLLKVGVNAQQLLTQSPDPQAVQARKVKWIGALRDVGVAIAAKSDGIQVDFKTTSAGGLTPQDLPLEVGSQAAPVVRRPTDVGFGMRDLAQTYTFGVAAAQATNPAGFARYEKQKANASKQLGIDIDKDVIDQFRGDASLSVGLDGSFALRSALADPTAFQKTLRTAAPNLDKLAKGEHVGIAVPKSPDGFYALATADGKKYVFGVVGGKFVVATDTARAAQFAGQSATTVPDAKGSLTMALDTRSVANEIAKQRGQSAAGLFTGALGDFVGSVESETSGLSGSFKLNIK